LYDFGGRETVSCHDPAGCTTYGTVKLRIAGIEAISNFKSGISNSRHQMFNLSGQIALVTGGSQGIGRAVALTLAELGADVAIMARTLEKCEAVADEIKAKGRRAAAVRGDMASAEDIKAAVAKVGEELGPISILVNNAAITRDGLMLRMKQNDWKRSSTPT